MNYKRNLFNIDVLREKDYPRKDKKTPLFDSAIDKKYSLTAYILFFFTFGFAGWMWEILLHLINYGTFVNRGVLYGPCLPIYGFGGVIILVLLKKFRRSPFNLFIASLVLSGILEYATAWFLETFRHLKYWDYSGWILNLHGRICLEGLIVFGLGGCAATYIAAPLLDNIYSKINLKFKKIICVILILIFLFDAGYSFLVKPNTGKGITSEVLANKALFWYNFPVF